MIAHCELMGDRVAILDPPPGLNAQQVKEWRVDKAGYDSQVRHALLAVDQGRSTRATGPDAVRAAVRPHRRHLGPQRRHPRRAQGAGQRGRPRRDRARAQHHQGRARPAQPDRASTASGRSPAAASASGARGRCPATRRGATSTSGGSSTTSRSRSSTAPSGWSSSRTTTRCGRGSGGRSAPSWSASGATGALFGLTPDEAFFVKCDGETNPAEGIDAGQVVVRDRRRAGEAGRVRGLPPEPSSPAAPAWSTSRPPH